MKKNNIIKILIVLIVSLILIITLVTWYLSTFFKQKTIEKRDYYTIIDNVITTDKAKELIKAIPFSTITLGEIKDAYCGEFVTKNNVKEMLLAMSVIGNFYMLTTEFTDAEKQEIANLLEENEIARPIVILRDKIDNFLNINYNTNISELEITESNEPLYFRLLNEKYVIIVLVNANSDFIKDIYGYLIKENNGDLIIEENVLFVLQSNNVFSFYNNTSLDKAVLVLESTSYEQIKLKHMKELAKIIKTYKHTFKKDNSGNYYWYSTEMIK